jgi:putative ABC transport system ATP-binding protein
MIKLENLTKIYHLGEETVHALAGISLDISEGEFVAIVGPSGSGKSTLMHIIGGLDSPTFGRVIIDGCDLSNATDKQLAAYRNRSVGFVFQTFNLHPTYDSLENVAMPLIFARRLAFERRQRAMDALAEVGLTQRARHLPNQLSGGERQRVSIARALVTRPKIILADEPTGNLDIKTGENIVDILSRLNEKGLTLVVVTHNADIANRAQRVIHMADGHITAEKRSS